MIARLSPALAIVVPSEVMRASSMVRALAGVLVAACSAFAPDVGSIRAPTQLADGSTGDASANPDGGQGGDGSGCPIDPAGLLAPCLNATDYQTGVSTIVFGGTLGHVYSPNCIKIPPGSTLTWQGDFETHPLTPSTRGTQPNPIVATTGGTTPASFTFPQVGLYPFYCAVHGDNSGDGMSGVVWVCP